MCFSAAHAVAALSLLWPVRALQSPDLPVAVIGATGKLGRHAVQQLLEHGRTVRCLVRHDPSSAEASTAPSATAAEVTAWLATLPGVELIQGDITDQASVTKLVRGCSACLALHGAKRTTRFSDLLPWTDPTQDATHSKRVNYEGVQHVITAARASGTCRRIVRVTGKGEDPWSMTAILINGLGSMAKAWNYEGERLLRECKDIDYTIVRPGMMGKGDEKLQSATLVLADNGGDLKVSSIPHRSVAQLCVRCLEYPNAARTTLCAMTIPGNKGLELFEEHQAAVRLGLIAALGIALGFAAGLFSVLQGFIATLAGT